MIKTIKKIWKNITTNNRQPLIDKINELRERNNSCDEYLIELNADFENLQFDYDRLQEKNNLLLDKLADSNKHYSLENYKDWLEENIAPTRIFYNFGNGRKAVHTIFADSIKDEEIIREFIKEDLGFDASKFRTPDGMVVSFSNAFTRKYPTNKYYSYDKDLYGKVEQWDIAKNTINFIRTKNTYGDCDNVMVLKYSCLYYLLKDRFPEDIWRLRGFIVSVLGYGGHAMLGWVKSEDNINDWVPIETTFYAGRQGIMWSRNYTIRDQILYNINYSFDHEHEYRRI